MANSFFILIPNISSITLTLDFTLWCRLSCFYLIGFGRFASEAQQDHINFDIVWAYVFVEFYYITVKKQSCRTGQSYIQARGQ